MKFLEILIQLSLIVLICDASNETTTEESVTEAPFAETYDGEKELTKEFNSKKPPKCKLVLENPVHAKIVHNLLKIDKLNLIQYKLKFVNYTKSPLRLSNSLDPNKWFRTASDQGLILLILPFNHDLLSLKTLSLGTTKIDIDLVDKPPNCMQTATSKEQLYSIQHILIRDFYDTSVELKYTEGICRKILLKNKAFAKFVHECIVFGEDGPEVKIIHAETNMWLEILDILLLAVRVVAMAYIPVSVISIFKGIIKKKIPYTVKLKENTFIRKKIIITDDENIKKEYKKNKNIEVLDLAESTRFPRLKSILRNGEYTLNEELKVRFYRYDILVDYHRTQPENNAKVGLVQTLMALIFRCKIKHLGSFVQCCQAEMNKYLFRDTCTLFWITFFRKAAAAFLIIILPLPYYIRLAIYYHSGEREQINARKDLSHHFNLNDAFANSFVLYMTPTHPVLIAFYVIYFITGFIVSVAPSKNIKADRHQVLRRLVNSFRDLDEFSLVRVFSYVVSILTWPFFKYGWLGCFIAPFYWILTFPLVFFVCLIYSIPTFYLINRMVYYCRKAVWGKMKDEPTQPEMYQVQHGRGQKKLLTKLKLEKVLPKYKGKALTKILNHRAHLESTTSNPVFEGLADHITDGEDDESNSRASCLDTLLYIITTILCIITFCGIAFVAADLVVFLVEVIIFTIMGIIVNAGYVLRHVLVTAIVILYCFDNFFILEKKYLKMNKVIFAEVHKRIKDLDQVTSLPSKLQENRGFKAQESVEKTVYENCDSVVPVRHWLINDLVLFMDSEDTPRIPVKLFKDVCSIHVPGVPGPVYRGQLDALKQLGKVLFMVFMVVIAVMVFGEVYSISSTNQLIATVAGSFIPLLFRSFIFKQSSDVEVSTMTFKCHVDELIERFHQNWPIYDMLFQFDHQHQTSEEVATNERNPFKDDSVEFVICLPKNFKRRSDNGTV